MSTVLIITNIIIHNVAPSKMSVTSLRGFHHKHLQICSIHSSQIIFPPKKTMFQHCQFHPLSCASSFIRNIIRDICCAFHHENHAHTSSIHPSQTFLLHCSLSHRRTIEVYQSLGKRRGIDRRNSDLDR